MTGLCFAPFIETGVTSSLRRCYCCSQVLDACLKEITTALLQADVNVKLVMNLRTNVKTRANNADKGAGLNKRKIIEKSVVDELSSMLSSGSDEKQLVDLKKGKPNVVMFVGLQARCPTFWAFNREANITQFLHIAKHAECPVAAGCVAGPERLQVACSSEEFCQQPVEASCSCKP